MTDHILVKEPTQEDGFFIPTPVAVIVLAIPRTSVSIFLVLAVHSR